MIYRDDDVSMYTCAYAFKTLHEKFIQHDKVHTVALIMKDLWQNHALFWYLATAPNLEIGLHGWEHKDYSTLSYEECFSDLKRSLEYWIENSTRMTKRCKPITTFFAPWNRESENIKKACADLGLIFCNTATSNEIRSFHHWNTMNDKFNIESFFV